MIDSIPLQTSQTSRILLRVDDITSSVTSNADFLSQLFHLMSSVVRSNGGHLWQINVGENLQAMARIGEESEHLNQEYAMAVELSRSLVPAFQFYHEVVPSHSNLCCLLIPLLDGENCLAIVSLNVTVPNSDAAEAYLAMLMAIAERSAKNRVRSRFAKLEQESARNAKANNVVDGISKHLDIKELAYDVVNRLQHYLEADRVSLAVCRGGTTQIQSISNQAVFDRRSNVVKHLRTLAGQVAGMETPLIYPQFDQELPPSLTRMIEKYFEVAHSVGIVLLPIFASSLRRDDPEDIAGTIQGDEERKKCIAVLIIEGIESTLDTDRIMRRWSRIESPISNAVANSRAHDGLFLMPVWRSFGAFAELYRGHTRRKALIITGVIVGVIVSLLMIRSDFKVRGEGVIQPIVRQHLYAEAEGTIDKLLAAEGAEVKKGDLLINLRNPELASRVAEVAGKLRETESQLQTVTLQRASRSFSDEQEERELVRTSSTAVAKIAGLKEQLELLQRNERQLEIHSPIDGQIITWNIEQRLRDRPVKPGQRLLTVAVPSGGWEIELRIPDKRAGYLLREWQESLNRDRSMMVSFVLSSDSTRVYQAPVIHVSPTSEVDDKDSENVVRVRVRPSDETFSKIAGLKPGTTVIGHVHCGTASIGYCKLYEFFDWIQLAWFQFIA